MRVLLAALASLAANIAFWIHYRGLDALDAQLQTRDAQKDLVLLVLGAWLVAEGVALVIRGRSDRNLPRESISAAQLEEELDSLYQQRELYQAEIQKAREELAYTNRRMQAVVTERDGLKALVEEVESQPAPAREGREREGREGAPVTAVPLTRSARL